MSLLLLERYLSISLPRASEEFLIVSPFAAIPVSYSTVLSGFVLTTALVATTRIVVLMLLVVTGFTFTLSRVCFVFFSLLLYFVAVLLGTY